MRIIPIALFSLLLISSVSAQSSLSIYINNNAGNNPQNGTYDFPWANFSIAFFSSIVNISTPTKVSVIFDYSSTPYPVNFTLENSNVVSLTLGSTNTANATQPGFACSDYPTIMMQQRGGVILNSGITLNISYLNVVLANGNNVGFNLAEGPNYILNVFSTCLNPNTNMTSAVLFEVRGMGTASLNFIEVNITASPGNRAQVLQAQANAQLNVTIAVAVLNLVQNTNYLPTLFSAIGGPGLGLENNFNITRLQITGSHYGETLFEFFHVDNINVVGFFSSNFAMSGKDSNVKNSYFYSSAAASIQMQYIYANGSSSNGLHILYLDNVQLRNFTRIYLATINFYQTTNISLVDSKLSEFQMNISSLTINNCTIAHNPLIYFSSKFSHPPLKSIRHLFNNFQIGNSTISAGLVSLSHVDESNVEIEDLIPAYILTVNVLNVQNNNISTHSFINTGGVSIFLEAPNFFNNNIQSTVVFSASQVLTNLNLLNGMFNSDNYHKASLLKTPAMPSADSVNKMTEKLLLYKLAAIINCRFTNISVMYDSEFLNSASPFIIFSNNILSGIRLYSSVMMTTTGITAAFSSFSMRNKSLEAQIFGRNHVVLNAFENLFNTTPHCLDGCYFVAVVNNTFDTIFTGKAAPLNVFELNINKDSITHYQFASNTFINSNISTNYVRVNKRNNAFNAVLNTFFNLTCFNMFTIQSSSNNFNISSNTITTANYSKIFDIEIVHAGSNTTIHQNTIYHSMSSGLFRIVSPNNLNLTIDSTLFTHSAFYSYSYSQLAGIYIQLSSDTASSHVTISNFLGFFCAIGNRLSLAGYYPPLENTFFYVQTFAKSQLNLINVNLTNITTVATYSSIANFQSGTIFVNNFTSYRVTCNDSIGYAYSFQAAIFTIYQANFIKNHLNVPEIFVSTHSLVYIAFPNGVHQNTFNLTKVGVEYWYSSTPAFFINNPAVNLYVSNFLGYICGSAFYLASQYANITFINPTFYTRQNTFFAMSNQPGFINITVIGYHESYNEDMPKISGDSQFSFIIPNKIIEFSVFNNTKVGKVGFLQGTQTIGPIYFNNITLIKQDPTNFQVGFISFTGGYQQVHVNTLVFSNLVNSFNQSFINMLTTAGNSSVQIFNVIATQSEFTALINLQGPAGLIGIQNLSATNSGFSLVNHQQNNMTMCVISIYNVILYQHNTIFFAVQGAYITKIFNMTVSESELSSSSYITSFNGGNIFLSNSTFIQNAMGLPPRPMIQLNNGNVLIINVIYTKNTGPIEITNAVANVTNLTAFKNVGQKQGAVLYFNGSSFQVEYCNFTNNTAVNAPVIYANVTSNTQSYVMTNNIIANNTNQNGGKAIGGPANKVNGNFTLVPVRVAHLNNLFNTYLTFQSQLINSSFRYSQYNVSNVSNFLLNYTQLKISLQDFKGQTIDEGSKDFSVTVITNGQAEELEVVANKGIVTINGSAINLNGSLPVNSLNFIIYYAGEKNYLNLNLNVRGCLPGEYVDNTTNLCVLCPPGLYSVNPKEPCHICPEGATCYGGNVVEVNPGYWLFPTNGMILPCPSKGCQGGYDVENQCAMGYAGGMCLGCDASMDYSEDTSGNCKLCTGSSFGLFMLFFLKLMLSFLFEIFFIFVVYRANRKYNKMMQETVLSGIKLRNALDINMIGAQLKLFASYSQYLFILAFYLKGSFFLDSYSIVADFLTVARFTGAPSYVATLTIECLFLSWNVNPEDLPFDVMTFHLYFPVIKLAIYFGGVCLMNAKGKIKDINLLVNTAIISYLLMEMIAPLQNILQFCMCTMTGYVYGNYSISCSDPTYVSYVHDVGVIVIIFWLVIVPFSLFFLVFKNRDRLNNPVIRNTIGTLTNNYKESTYYWGFVTLGFKMALIILFTIFQDAQTATSLAFILMMLNYYLSVRYEPYTNIEIEKQDKICTIAIASSMFLASIAIRTEYEAMVVVAIILAIIINLAVYVPTAWRIVASYIRVRRAKKNAAGLLDKISNDPNEQKMDTMKIT